jgi:endonuclease/exonuclease/phosphatase (EEP) superfamily protein YafD
MREPGRTGGAIDRLLRRLGEALRDRESRKVFLRKVVRGVRAFLFASTLLYAATVIVSLLAMRWIGERNVTFAFLLYVPRQAWLLPLAFLFPPTLLFHWKLAAAQLAGAALFVMVGMGFELAPRTAAVGKDATRCLTMLTYNRGEHMKQSLQPFKNLTRPDIIALQDSPRRADAYAKATAGQEFTHTRQEGEFALLSRFPIVSSALMAFDYNGRLRPVAARFEIDFNSTRIALYSVHMPTPRSTLNYYERGAFLYGLIGLPGTSFGEKRKVNQEYWDQRIALAREFLRIVEAERLPCVVVGDLNAPAGGYVHGLFAEKLQDAHSEVGEGFGYSFPGVTRNPLSLGGPWMRIDYAFVSRDWRLNSCTTEKHRPSQHRAVAATFELKPRPPQAQ